MVSFLHKIQYESNDGQKIFYSILSASLVFVLFISLYLAYANNNILPDSNINKKSEEGRKENITKTNQSAAVIQSLGRSFFSIITGHNNESSTKQEKDKNTSGRKPYVIEI